VLLLRYESLTIDSKWIVNLSAAFDAATGYLLCAFTDPAPTWIRSRTTSSDIVTKAGHEYSFAPAHYSDLRSNLVDVLAKLHRTFVIDASKAPRLFGDRPGDPAGCGQIVIRPRFITNRLRRWDHATGTPIELPPVNAWVVEVLGTLVDRDAYFPKSNLVAEFRDGDLELLLGVLLN
jgi:hypothetical protein